MSSTISFIVPPALFTNISFDNSSNGFETTLLLNMTPFGVPLEFEVCTRYISSIDGIDPMFSGHVYVAQHSGFSKLAESRANSLIDIGIPAIHDARTVHHKTGESIEPSYNEEIQKFEDRMVLTLQQTGYIEREPEPNAQDPQTRIIDLENCKVSLDRRWL